MSEESNKIWKNIWKDYNSARNLITIEGMHDYHTPRIPNQSGQMVDSHAREIIDKFKNHGVTHVYYDLDVGIIESLLAFRDPIIQKYIETMTIEFRIECGKLLQEINKILSLNYLI